jgi:hypothetical protein
LEEIIFMKKRLWVFAVLFGILTGSTSMEAQAMPPGCYIIGSIGAGLGVLLSLNATDKKVLPMMAVGGGLLGCGVGSTFSALNGPEYAGRETANKFKKLEAENSAPQSLQDHKVSPPTSPPL